MKHEYKKVCRAQPNDGLCRGTIKKAGDELQTTLTGTPNVGGLSLNINKLSDGFYKQASEGVHDGCGKLIHGESSFDFEVVEGLNLSLDNNKIKFQKNDQVRSPCMMGKVNEKGLDLLSSFNLGVELLKN